MSFEVIPDQISDNKEKISVKFSVDFTSVYPVNNNGTILYTKHWNKERDGEEIGHLHLFALRANKSTIHTYIDFQTISILL